MTSPELAQINPASRERDLPGAFGELVLKEGWPHRRAIERYAEFQIAIRIEWQVRLSRWPGAIVNSHRDVAVHSSRRIERIPRVFDAQLGDRPPEFAVQGDRIAFHIQRKD